MNLDEILTQLDSFCTWAKESLDKDAEEWGELKSREDHNKELRDIKLSQLKLNIDGSDVKKTTVAKASQEWTDFVNGQIANSAEYHTLNYKKGFKEKLIEVLRSLLSFNKDRTLQDT